MMVKKIKSNHLEKIEHKELSIQFSLDGFSFCVLDTDFQEFVAFTKYLFSDKINTPQKLLNNIKQLFRTDEDLLLDYDKINVIHENKLSSFVPKALFKKENIKNYIAFNNKIFDNDFFTFDSIVNQEMNLVYVPYVNVNNFLIDQFGTFNYKHISSILVENLLNYFSINEGVTFFVNVSKTHFEIVVGERKKLLFYNTFQYATKEDFIYYILFTIEQLNLNTESVSLKLLGEIQETSELYQIVYKYVRDVSFIEDKFTFNLSLSIENKIVRENFSLFHF